MESSVYLKITVACSNRFHLFDQAYQLFCHKVLYKLITNYPKFKTRQWNIPDELVIARPIYGLFNRIIFKFASYTKPSIKSQLIKFMHQHFAKTLPKIVPIDTDVLICHSSFFLEAISWAQSKKILTIVDHGSIHEKVEREILQKECEKFGFKPFGNWQYEWLIKREDEEFSLVDYIFVCSKLAKKTLIDNGISESKIIVNNLGVDLKGFYPGKKNDKVFRVIYCGGIHPRKGVHYLVKAFSELGLPHSELLLVGAPPSDPAMKLLIQKYLNKNQNIFLKGPFPQFKLRDVYTQGSVFVLPSLADGFAMVVLQAMACGLPVIVTDMTGAAEVVENGINGFIIPSRSVDAIKEKLSFLYEHQDLCAEMGKNAYESVKSGYTWDDYGKRLINFLEKVSKRLK